MTKAKPDDPDLIVYDDDPDALLGGVLAYFRQCYADTPRAGEYMAKRGLDDPRLIAYFGVGFADGTLAKQLPPTHRVAGKKVRAALIALGIHRATGHGHFDGSVVFTITNPAGKVIDLYGRKITPRLRRGSVYHTYMHDPPEGIFNLRGLGGATDAILCPSILNALSFWVAGYHNVCACYGPGGLADEHVRLLALRNIGRVNIAFRRTSAGQDAAAAIAERLVAAGISAYRIDFPRGQDANDYLLNNQPAERAFGQVIRAATWLGQGDRERVAVQAPAAVDDPPDEEQSLEPEQQDKDELVVQREDRRYRIRGLAKNLSYSVLKINLMVTCGEAFYIDTLDLYVARQRTAFIKYAAGELHLTQETIKADVGKVILRLEEIQDERIEQALKGNKPEPFVLNEDDRRDAVALLEDPNLIERIQGDLGAAGMIGETTNRLVTYLAATSRKLDRPLAIVIQSSSSAGKSSLMNSVLSFMPPEETMRFSAMTSQSLYYLGETDLKHRILAIAEEEGAERASYPLKLLQSEGALSIATTGKEGTSGRIRTVEYHVEGPVMILMTTTATEMDEELLNRCIVLAVDEGVEQTRAIHEQQRHLQTLDGMLADRNHDHVRQVHRNAQRLLRPLLVVNPLADRLTFLDDRTRTRRDHVKYLTLIQAIALLHQYQREVKTVAHQGQLLEYIEVTASDISLANELAAEVLTRSLDSLAPQTRRLLAMLDEMVAAAGDDEDPGCFSRRDVIDFTGWSYRRIGIHLRRLVELEYMTLRRVDGRHRYELRPVARSRADGRPVMGLVDVDALAQGEGADRSAMYGPNGAMYHADQADVPGCTAPVVQPQPLAESRDSAGCTTDADITSPLRGAHVAGRTGDQGEEAPKSG